MSRNGAGGVGQSPKSEVRGRKSTIRIDPSRPLRVGIRSWFWALEGATRAENWRKTTKFTKIGPETAFRGVLGLWRASKPDFRPSRPLLRVGRRKFTQMGGAGGEFWQENRRAVIPSLSRDLGLSMSAGRRAGPRCLDCARHDRIEREGKRAFVVFSCVSCFPA